MSKVIKLIESILRGHIYLMSVGRHPYGYKVLNFIIDDKLVRICSDGVKDYIVKSNGSLIDVTNNRHQIVKYFVQRGITVPSIEVLEFAKYEQRLERVRGYAIIEEL
jgi:hypothetical protein